MLLYKKLLLMTFGTTLVYPTYVHLSSEIIEENPLIRSIHRYCVLLSEKIRLNIVMCYKRMRHFISVVKPTPDEMMMLVLGNQSCNT